MKTQTPRFTILCPPMERIILLASTLILPWVSLARADPVDPVPPGKLPGPSGLSGSESLSQQEREDVVRESLKIQRQLGGSLDQKYDLLQSIPNELKPTPKGQDLLVPADFRPTRQAPDHSAGWLPPRLQHAPHHPIPGHRSPGCPHCHHRVADDLLTQGQPIKLLRETACELDGAANRLERANLYDQADALRDLAQKLRLTARERQSSKSLSKKSP